MRACAGLALILGSLNACTRIPVKIKHNHLDDLILFIQCFVATFGSVPGLFKADIDSAFRRIPIFPGHRWAASVMYEAGGVVCNLCVVWPSLLRCVVVVGVYFDTLRVSFWRKEFGLRLGESRQGPVLSCAHCSPSEHISLCG